MSKKLVVGNWKLGPSTLEEAERVIKFLARKKWKGVTVAVCPPAVFLSRFTKKKSPLLFGVQNVYHQSTGAFTGEISGGMAKSAGANFAIVGHSERRAMGENNAEVARRVSAALKAGLRAILCVGEKERDSHGHYLSYLKAQIDESLAGISKTQTEGLVIAYEPLWAIGEKSPGAILPRDLEETGLFIRKVLHGKFGKKAFAVPIIYGGSVDPVNTSRLVKEGVVDGLLVGRESLKPEHFLKIIAAVEEAK